MPKGPQQGETKQEFMNRCMSSDEYQEEFDSQDQRFAVCQSQWEKNSRTVNS